MSKKIFNLSPEFIEDYHLKIDEGKNFLLDKKIIVTGLTRNSGSYLIHNIAKIDLLKQYCKELSYFIYENDSRDNTVEVLNFLSLEVKNFDYKSENLLLTSFGSIKSQERTMNLAKHRNTCLSYIREKSKNNHYVIVADLDFNSFSLDGLLNSFGWLSHKKISAMAGFSFELKPIFSPEEKVPWNYDSWAYRDRHWYDVQLDQIYPYDPMIWFGFWHPPVGSPPMIVNSAFGGMAIYKTKDYLSSIYDGYDCEHVCFHKNLYAANKNFKLGMNPSQIMLI